MMWRRSLPLPLKSLKGRPLGYAQCTDDRMIGVYRDFLAITRPEGQAPEVLIYEWTDVASASWEHTRRELRISFVDSSVPPLVVRLEEGKSENIAPLIHERVDSSFFWRQRQKLPSGTEAVFMIRVGKDSRLSIQALYDTAFGEEDKGFIASMYERMRDLAGMTRGDGCDSQI